MDADKTKAVMDWPRPTIAIKIRSFLELASYYRQFIEGFARLLSPMTKLIRKGEKFEWSDTYECAFQELKRKLTTTLVLAIPRSGEKYSIYSDAPHSGLGCVLM